MIELIFLGLQILVYGLPLRRGKFPLNFFDSRTMSRVFSLCVLHTLLFSNILYGQTVPVNYRIYRFSGRDSVPSRYFPQSNELYLSGFDTDGKGTFYFAGGNPLQIVCFRDTAIVYRRVFDGKLSLKGIFGLRKDSIYVIADQQKELIRLHKSGQGEAVELELPVREICGGRMAKNSFMLYCPVASLVNGDTVYYKEKCVYEFDYSFKMLSCKKVSKEEQEELLYPRPYSHNVPSLFYYKGDYKGYGLYWGTDCGKWQLLLTDKEGQVKYNYDIPMPADDPFSIIPLQVLGIYEDAEVHRPSPDFEVLRNGRFYTVGFDGKKNKLIVTEVDLSVVFP